MHRKFLIRHPFKIALTVIGMVLIALFGINRWRGRPELMWNDKPASYWVAGLSIQDRPNGAGCSAEEFLFEAGPDVVPVLIRGLKQRDNWISDQWVNLYAKLPHQLRQKLQVPTSPIQIREQS